ncbi:L-asparaginase/beta-aspartyl-peptidase (threonine type) [Pseudoduganella lurida]|uniref:L-asparaginase/beta-aspartyl-peptidase (Threonine type) n=1 Tax=Pseudoduganella lurida TaxID=1036180 RepID=A0A562RIK9_9BURK|nr:isoaspartyl peptidase/L-asparaginase [Pseudoduganella lurida]TWI68942.1 L-asparaginase/beta-aspartyl-peptidase (threonine type) [Pseudoduganella lurida]
MTQTTNDARHTVAAVVTHGGAGGSRDQDDGCQLAARAGLDRLHGGGSALDGAVAACVALEDDGRYNAGSGAVLCLDGKSVELDASIMDSQGALGAVACIQRVKNPVLVAQAVSRSPHWLLAGAGAEAFARTVGFEHHLQISERQMAKHVKLMAALGAREPVTPGVANRAFHDYWNYDTAPAFSPCDTVGAVARDAQGNFAVACSTGGSAPSLLGRVGDTPIIGSGFYAGSAGAIAVTGIGEHIVRKLLAYTVHGWIEGGMGVGEAVERGVALFPQEIDVGIIAITHQATGMHSNREMPCAQTGAPA